MTLTQHIFGVFFLFRYHDSTTTATLVIYRYDDDIRTYLDKSIPEILKSSAFDFFRIVFIPPKEEQSQLLPACKLEHDQTDYDKQRICVERIVQECAHLSNDIIFEPLDLLYHDENRFIMCELKVRKEPLVKKTRCASLLNIKQPL